MLSTCCRISASDSGLRAPSRRRASRLRSNVQKSADNLSRMLDAVRRASRTKSMTEPGASSPCKASLAISKGAPRMLLVHGARGGQKLLQAVQRLPGAMQGGFGIHQARAQAAHQAQGDPGAFEIAAEPEEIVGGAARQGGR